MKRERRLPWSRLPERLPGWLSGWLSGRGPRLALLASCSLLLISATVPQRHPVLVVAHRGASHGAPENTMAAFELARRHGADWLELDIRQSRDGALVVIHDEALKRTTGAEGRVQDHDLAALRQLDAGRWFGKEFAGERIPELKDVLDRFLGRIGLLVELKDPELYPGMEDELVRLLEPYEGRGELALQSFDLEALRRVHGRLPGIPAAALVREPEAEKPPAGFKIDWKALGTEFSSVNIQSGLADAAVVKEIHEAGGRVMVWTISGRREMEQAIGKGVDGVIANDPSL
ncbi:glycerophosphodiester phosphodiesterase [Paenibacillus humicus]|uniref:glycerophosphodiester phosphodiesterase n=1 Tax=Paenibacillus humicus TaxID=412861 RepID=UPI000FD88FFF|nr:glycerophosphodiester phosphodiesterase family protein [Paenibacillus humicus]